MKAKLKKEDIVFSKLIRTRDGWRCRKCGVGKDQAQIQCAHIMGRRSTGLRWHPQNAVALCARCHMFFTSHPFEWVEWCNDKFGEEKVTRLRQAASKPVKWTKAQKEDIYRHMRKEADRAPQARAIPVHPLLEEVMPN